MTQTNNTTDKAKSPPLPQHLRALLSQPLDVKLHLVQHHMELARLLVHEILEEEVTQRAGDRYSRDKPFQGRYSRWGKNPGSVRIGQEKVPIEVPRLVDKHTGETFAPESYQALHDLPALNDRLSQAILLGLSTADYGRVVQAFTDGFGLSQASVSRSFIERSAKALEAFEQRSLAGHDFVALLIDGKHLARQQIVIALGITMEGQKLPVGFVQTTTENGEAIKGLLKSLIERGLRFEEGLLCIIDGAKGLRAAVEQTFGEYAEIQRCQWHKRENVVSYLSEADQGRYRRRLQQAYESESYAEAKADLLKLHQELLRVNRSAANSLIEGLEETLTLHRLGLFVELGKSLKTTNCIENLNSRLGKYLARVKYWQTSDQRHRWVALALLEIEQRMRRISGYKALPKLRKALQASIRRKQEVLNEEPLAEKEFQLALT